jgi:hypothetical protein
MEWIDLAKAGEWLLTGWVVMMVAIGLVAIASEVMRRRRHGPRHGARRIEEER